MKKRISITRTKPATELEPARFSVDLRDGHGPYQMMRFENAWGVAATRGRQVAEDVRFVSGHLRVELAPGLTLAEAVRAINTARDSRRAKK